MVVVFVLTTLEPAMPTGEPLTSQGALVALGEGDIAKPFVFTSAALAKEFRKRLPPDERDNLHVSHIPERGGSSLETHYSLKIFSDCEIFCGLFESEAAAQKARKIDVERMGKYDDEEEKYAIKPITVLTALPPMGSGVAIGETNCASEVIDLTGE